MIGELNLGHCYVGGGDYPKPERIPLGLLGAKIVRDAVRFLPDHRASCPARTGTSACARR